MSSKIAFAMALFVPALLYAEEPDPQRLMSMAKGKYTVEIKQAQIIYDKALADAAATLVANYDKSIELALKRGPGGLELANKLNADKKDFLGEHPVEKQDKAAVQEAPKAALDYAIYHWHPGDRPIKMLAVTDGFCFISGIAGHWAGSGESVFIEVKDGWWYLTGQSSQPDVGVDAIAVKIHRSNSK